MVVSVGICTIIELASQFVSTKRQTLAKDEAQLGAGYQLLHNKFCAVDEIYDKGIPFS